MLRRPQPIDAHHVIDGFDSGKPELDRYLSDMALSNQNALNARTFVIADKDYRVVGYYALCAGMISRRQAPRQVAGHGAPRDIPVALLARLAVDRTFQGRGLGASLLRSAFLSVLAGAEHVAFRAVMVHAIDDDAMRFYQKFGFRQAKGLERTLLMPLQDIIVNFRH
jgi:GNAT superfamily N-acetyltransferase